MLLLAVAFLAGCQKSADVAPAPSLDDLLPKQAQPKLRTMKIYLGAEILDAEMALTDRTETYRHDVPHQHPGDRRDAVCFSPAVSRDVLDEKLSRIHLRRLHRPGRRRSRKSITSKRTTPTRVVAARDNIQYVLEVKDGWFARHNINPGTVIRTEKGSLSETFFSKP